VTGAGWVGPLRRGRWRMPRLLVLGVFLLVAMLFPAGARADAGATLYVDQHNLSCSDSGAGTAAQPFCTIGAAATKLRRRRARPC
jgi:hypothetical protein